MREAQRVGIVVQVRLGSTRLPGKALIEVAGKPLLRHLCDRLMLSRRADDLIVATSDQAQDGAIEGACRSWGIPVWRGPEKDLTTRLLGAARARGLSALVRATGDNPLTDPGGIDEMITAFKESGKGSACQASVVYNSHREGYPLGTGAEISSRRLLEICDRELQSPGEREGFMSFARQHPERFACLRLDAPPRLSRPDYFFTVDYPEDLELQKEIYAHFHDRDDMTLEAIEAFLDDNPHLARLNSHLHSPFAE